MFRRIKSHFFSYVSRVVSSNANLEDNKDLTNRLRFLYFLKTFSTEKKSSRRYTYKIQKYKLYLKNNGFERYVDKLIVRDWIKDIIGEQYLFPVYAIWDKAEDISFEGLPDKFVLKTNHGAGMNIVIKDRMNTNLDSIRIKIKSWLSVNYALKNGLELQYSNIKPKVYAEKFMSDSDGKLSEYKFLCISGKPLFCICDIDRFEGHKRNIYDMNFVLQKWNIGAYENMSSFPKPTNFEEMKEIARKLCNGFPLARIDLYSIDGTIYFSEITLTPGSGYSFPKPISADYMLGDMWNDKSIENIW